jgi:hypothetical protein
VRVVVELLEDAELDGAPLTVAERGQRLAEVGVEAVEPRLVNDGCVPLAGERDSEPLARPVLDRLSAHRLGEDVARDPEEPRRGASLRPVTEAGPRKPRRRERLRGQLERSLPVAGAAQQEAVDAVGVAVVQLPERLGAPARPVEQLRIRGARHLSSISRRPPPALPPLASLPRCRTRETST